MLVFLSMKSVILKFTVVCVIQRHSEIFKSDLSVQLLFELEMYSLKFFKTILININRWFNMVLKNFYGNKYFDLMILKIVIQRA